MWQAPVLGLTAQAFLFTIALAAGSSEAARLMAASLAIVISAMSVQLVMRHRHFTVLDAILLEKLEVNEELSNLLGAPPHAQTEDLEAAAGRRPLGLAAFRSYRIWVLGLALFGAAAGAVIVMTLLSPTMLR